MLPASPRLKTILIWCAVIVSTLYFTFGFINDLFSLQDWRTQRRGIFAQLWTVVTSREGSIIVPGLVAALALFAVLVDRKLEAARDVKWKRRRRILDNRTARLGKTKSATLTDSQREGLFALQGEIKELYNRAEHGRLELLDVEIQKWEERAGTFLETVWDKQHRALVMDAPYEPANRAGYSKQNRLIGWTQLRLEKMNQLIEELREH